MAEGSYCASEFFCSSIAEFLDTTDVFENTEDNKLEKFIASIPLEVLQGDAAPPVSPPLRAPPSAYLVLATPMSCSA